MTNAEREARADVVIENHKSIEELTALVNDLWENVSRHAA
jgi:hypothetical protein